MVSIGSNVVSTGSEVVRQSPICFDVVNGRHLFYTAEGGTDIRCFRHLYSLNKWQYRDEYIIVILELWEKLAKNYD